jgi:CcmB protein
MSSALLTLTQRDLRLARRRQVEALLPLGFFVVAAGLFPLGVGPETQTLRQIGPGWPPCCRSHKCLPVTMPMVRWNKWCCRRSR